ncbi:MAG: hypothetical protein V4749_12160 [Pseudomonadota bacterium]
MARSRLLIGALLLVCGLQAVWIYFDRPSAPVLSQVIARYPMGTQGMVYGVLSDAGGATVPFTYHYFLAAPMDDDQVVLDTLRKQGHSFLVTRDANARVVVLGYNVNVKVTGTVNSFHSSTLLRMADGYVPVTVSLDAQVGQ